MRESHPRLKKTEWPKYVADALGIPEVQGSGGPWHSTGDTTDLVWFERLCEALGVPYQGSRVATMRALVEAVGESWDPATMSSELTKSRGGGNVKVAAFEALWRGLNESRPGSNALESKQAMRELARAEPAAPNAADQHVLRLIRLRQGQPAFRAALLQAYENRCAITETDTIEILEAAHITPFSEGGPMAPVNGLLLRADMHTLFDLGLIAVDTSRWTVLVHPKLRETQFGIDLDGAQVRRPRDVAMHPDVSRLDAHRRILGL